MNFCSNCGNPVSQKIPDGDNRLRYVCDHCGAIHYQNPRVIAGILPTYNQQILLCKRAIEPRHGFWTLPAGFLENGESTLEGAQRECQEEANANVINPILYALYDIPRIHQVYVFYRDYSYFFLNLFSWIPCIFPRDRNIFCYNRSCSYDNIITNSNW